LIEISFRPSFRRANFNQIGVKKWLRIQNAECETPHVHQYGLIGRQYGIISHADRALQPSIVSKSWRIMVNRKIDGKGLAACEIGLG